MGIPRALVVLFFAVAAGAAVLLFPSARELGRVHAAAGNAESALRWLELQRDADPADRANGMRLLKATDVLYLDQRFDEAAIEMERLFGGDPELLRLRIEHARGRMRTDQLLPLLRQLYRTTANAAEREETFYTLRDMYLFDGQLSELAHLERVELERKPQDWIFSELISVQTRLSRPFAALRHAREWARVQPERPEPVLAQVEILNWLGKRHAVMRVLDRAMGLQPNDRLILFAYERALIGERLWEAAARVLEHYLESHAGDVEAWEEATRIYQQLERYEAAAHAAERWYALDANGTQSALALAEAWVRVGKAAEAADLLARMHQTGEGNHRTHHLLGDLWTRLGRADAARQEYLSALGLLRGHQ
jgi:tetratricopeptide (TPR) repeat protein